MTKLMHSNKELDPYKTLQEQGIQQTNQLDFYYSQQFNIKCLCDNQNFNLEVQGLTKIKDYFNIFQSKFTKSYQQYEILVFCKGTPQKQDTLWVQTGITNSSQVEIKILLPVQFTYYQQNFVELIPSNWKIHKIITYITGKKQIFEIIQINSNKKIIDYDLELSQLYQNLNLQIEVVKEPSYSVKLQDGREKIIQISSKLKVSDLCELIKQEFNIFKTMNLELQYGLMKLNNQAYIIDEMILNRSQIIVNNQNLKFYEIQEESLDTYKLDYELKGKSAQKEVVDYQTSNRNDDKLKDYTKDQLKIILINKRNPDQCLQITVESSQEINILENKLIPQYMKDKFSIQFYLEKNKPIIPTSIFGSLEKDKENKINIEFQIQKKKSIFKNISSHNQTYEFRFLYQNKQYKETVLITDSLEKIEEMIKSKYKISDYYSIYSNDSFDQNQTILSLGLQSLNTIFEFKIKNSDKKSFQIIIQPIDSKENFDTSQVKNVFQLREKLKQKYLSAKDQRIQIKLKQKNLHDDELISQLIMENPQAQFEAIILQQFQVIFLGPNQEKLIDEVYEDYLIRDSVICLGLSQNCKFCNKQNYYISIDNSFQYYQINKQNSVIEYLDKDNLQKTPEVNRYSPYESNLTQNTYLQSAEKKEQLMNYQKQSFGTNNQEPYQYNANNLSWQYDKNNNYQNSKGQK
ncbi:unnamed protein product [Paramecium sonneborni]|uniref:Uncharacterized protein n=1 Tax=Paramecium sonneborni TaxID=65129 RepID=A0A8S1R428_9CILI|nr:unnamed protein product [Paramecium sonneborni]